MSRQSKANLRAWSLVIVCMAKELGLAKRMVGVRGTQQRSNSHLGLHLAKLGDGEFQVLLRVGGGDLRADSGLALWHDGIGKADDIDAFLEHGVGEAASKGGILSLTRQLALEYAEDNIRVLAVNPGTINTPLVDEALASMEGDPEEIKKEMGLAHPIGRIGQPDEIAQAVLFLASDRASFMTGEYVCVDGGMMARGAWA